MFPPGFDRGYTAGYKIAQYFGRLRGRRAARNLGPQQAAIAAEEQQEEENWSQKLAEAEASVLSYIRAKFENLRTEDDDDSLVEAEDWIRAAGQREAVRALLAM